MPLFGAVISGQSYSARLGVVVSFLLSRFVLYYADKGERR